MLGNQELLFWSCVFVSFGLGAISCWVAFARPAIKRAYFNGGFDSFPEHYELGRTDGRSGAALVTVTLHGQEICKNVSVNILADCPIQTPDFSLTIVKHYK